MYQAVWTRTCLLIRLRDLFFLYFRRMEAGVSCRACLLIRVRDRFFLYFRWVEADVSCSMNKNLFADSGTRSDKKIWIEYQVSSYHFGVVNRFAVMLIRRLFSHSNIGWVSFLDLLPCLLRLRTVCYGSGNLISSIVIIFSDLPLSLLDLLPCVMDPVF